MKWEMPGQWAKQEEGIVIREQGSEMDDGLDLRMPEPPESYSSNLRIHK
jgi:hypothetical protein